MEEEVYKKQITKLSTSKRVVDELQIDRHYHQQNISQYFNTKNIDPHGERPELAMPQDAILENLIKNYRSIHKYHIHDSLFENKVAEGLTQKEMNVAWKEFKEIKSNPKENWLEYRRHFQIG